MKAMCGVQLKDGQRAMNLTLMLCLNETIDQLCVCAEKGECSCLEKSIKL